MSKALLLRTPADFVEMDTMRTDFMRAQELSADAGRSGLRGISALIAVVAANLNWAQLTAASSETWRAIGHEPSWSLVRSVNEMTLETDFGANRVSFEVPVAARIDESTLSYTALVNGETLRLTVERALCIDTMSGMPRPDRVTIVLGTKRLTGCGGEPASLLQGRDWTVASLAGKPVLQEPPITLTFAADGRLSGSASCNRFGAGYTVTGEGIAIEKGMSSMMACEEPVMAQEQLFLSLLERVSRFSFDPDGALLLHTNDNRLIAAKRPPE
jgi:heat shock protein HslJ